MINILLCGGSGTRLWPISRELYPKQFCNLIGEHSLFQETLLRNTGLCKKSIIVTNYEHYFLSKSQIESIHIANTEFILEPIGRNTAPAIVLACLALEEEDIVVVTPSDHYIGDVEQYENFLKEARILAEAGHLVTFGIKPAYPEAGYGYIEADGENVLSFREKPSETVAKEYLESGNYFWNSGMFAFQVKTLLSEIGQYAEDILSASREAFTHREIIENIIKIPLAFMEKIPRNSIDYAVMEKSKNIKMIAADMDWSDLGSFEAIYEQSERDKNGNADQQDNILLESHNNFVLSSGKPITLIGAEDLIIVDTSDALLISKKGVSQKIRDAIPELEHKQPGITRIHQTVYRPWGSYTVLDESLRYKLKRILVKPGHSLSLQKHYHRSEHWTVVSGTAIITLSDKEITLCSNESVYIPIGEKHRLGNPGKIDLIIIETSVGDYLDEDDIVRYEDTYGRISEL